MRALFQRHIIRIHPNQQPVPLKETARTLVQHHTIRIHPEQQKENAKALTLPTITQRHFRRLVAFKNCSLTRQQQLLAFALQAPSMDCAHICIHRDF